MYTIGYAFQSVFFASIFSNCSYFIPGFGAGDISIMYIILIYIFLLFILNHLILVHIFTPRSIYHIACIMHCII